MLISLRSAAVAAALSTLLLFASPEVCVAATSADPSLTSSAEKSHFVARDQAVDIVFRAIATEIGKSIQTSKRARRAHITGDFALDHPFEVIERITSTLGLIWYFDGNTVYIYDASEIVSTMLAVPDDTLAWLVTFLKKNSLYDKRYPIHKGSQGVVYLSGPPKYVEIIRASIQLKKPAAGASSTASDTLVEVVRLRFASVDDRRYEKRGQDRWRPGLASVLRDIWQGLATVRVAKPDAIRNPGANDTRVLQAAVAEDGKLPALPPGVKELPPFEDESETASGGSLLRVVAYPSNNSLLLSGTARQIASAKELIAQLDTQKKQVELSLWVIDISQSDLDALGAQWSAEGRLGGVSLSINQPGALRSRLSASETMQFIASVSALSEKNHARIVSRPILLAQDNSPALFDSNRSFYVKLRGERTVALETVTYGTMINVVPRILDEAGPIEMDLEIEDGNSSNPDELSSLDLPDVSRTQISTVARVSGEQSLLVGGYTHDENRVRRNKIPLLGDIPLIGGFFRYRSTTASNSVRLFLIQPRILQDDETFEAGKLDRPNAIDNAVDALKKQVADRHG
jgi:type II secretory pathway component GspD/PulD (secretin)